VQVPRLVPGAVLVHDGDRDGVGPQRADHPAVAGVVRAQDAVRVVRPALDDGPKVLVADLARLRRGGGVAGLRVHRQFRRGRRRVVR
jgi:hypothetical protein